MHILIAATISFLFLCNEARSDDRICSQFCIRLFTNQGDIGCRSRHLDAVEGILVRIDSDADINLSKEMRFDKVIVISSANLVQWNRILNQHGQIVGAIVYDASPATSRNYYSSDVTSSREWNMFGNKIMESSLVFPVVHITSLDQSTDIHSACDHNQAVGYSTTSTKLYFAMINAYFGRDKMTSSTCLSWRDIHGATSPKCLPIGGQSVWATAGNLDTRDKVLATVAIDSTAEFHDLAHGANEAAASIAALLMAAELISRTSHSLLPLQIVFFLAGADEWAMAGSRRWIRDLLGQYQYSPDVGSLSDSTRNSIHHDIEPSFAATSSTSTSAEKQDGEGEGESEISSPATSFLSPAFSCHSYVPPESSPTGLPVCTDPVYPSLLFQRFSPAQIRTVVALDQIGSTSNNSLGYESNDIIRWKGAGDEEGNGEGGGRRRKEGISRLYVHAYSTNNCSRVAYITEQVLAALHQGAGSGSVSAAMASPTLQALQDQAAGKGPGCLAALPPTPLTSIAQATEELQTMAFRARGRKRIEAGEQGGVGEDVQDVQPPFNFDGVVIAGYDDKYSDPRYHSHTDTERFVSRTDITRAAIGLARTLVTSAGGHSGDVPAINKSWSDEVMDCLFRSWDCDLFVRYTEGERRDLGEITQGAGAAAVSLHSDAAASSASSTCSQSKSTQELPPTYYTGVLSVDGGQPLVAHGGRTYGRFSGSWSPKDRAFAMPSMLEASVRNILLHLLGDRSTSTDGATPHLQSRACERSSECKDACRILDFTAVAMQCVLGSCVCPNSHYHLALDPGVSAEPEPGYFTVTDPATAAYTEPYWGTLSVRMYAKTNAVVGYAMLAAGSVVAISSVAGALCLHAYLLQKNLIS